MSVGGVVLAAGAGTRFGEATKQLADLEGRPLLQHAVDAVAGADDVDPVFVVLGAQADAVLAGVRFGRAKPIVCEDWEEGMAASLRLGVRAVDDAGADWALIALGDQPRITSRVVEAVATTAMRAMRSTAAVRATYDGTPGHPVAISRALFGAVYALRGDVGARDLLANALVRDVEVGRLADPIDVDTQAELEALRT
jgi:molybdenum cofactor cytidylyltransferase/nicotine blue oxidoreductase